MEQKKKGLDLLSKLKPRYFLFVIDEQGREAVKYSQEKQSFMKMFSCHKYSEKVEEVKTDGWIDENKTIHSKARYDQDKTYLQARNIFEANIKFKQFIAHKNEKEKNQTANQELPQ